MQVNFQGSGARLAGRLHTLDVNAQAGAAPTKRPGIVVVGSWTMVKEQMPARYAALLSAAGLAALTFDFRGYGESGGGPREVESARAKAQDILDAAAFLATRAEIDADRIGVLAICASAHYTALAVQGSATFGAPLIKSVAMIAPWLHDAELVEQLYGGRDAVAQRLEQGRAAHARYVKSGEVEYVTAASNTDPSAAMFMEGDALDYYLNPRRGAVPEWGGRFAPMAWTEWLTMDSIALAPRFDVPLRIVTSEKSATPAGVKRFVDKLPAPDLVRDVVWGPPSAASQFDYYDDEATVRFAVDKAVEHFRGTLK